MPPRVSISRLRNLGIVAHVDAGKTTLTERILHATGRIHAFGSVDDGNTVTDSDPRERSRGITIGAAAVTTVHQGHELTLIDTPGHVDFAIEVERSLRVLDGAVVVLDAASGVEPQTEAVWAAADRRGIPRILFVNKIDHPGADFDAAVRSAARTFGVEVVPLVVPSPDELALVDLLDGTRLETARGSTDQATELPATLESLARSGRERIVEACAGFDENMLRAFVEGAAVSTDALIAALRRGTLSQKIVPCLAGSAKAGLGVSRLLDAIIALLPSPLDRTSDSKNEDAAHASSDRDPLVAFCFKEIHDDYGQRTFVRVYSGTLRKGASALVSRNKKRVRIGRLVRVFADSVEDIDMAVPGDIAAILGVALSTGDTLSDEGIALEGLDVREPVVAIAIEPSDAEARARLGPALRRLLDEDPSLALGADAETGQTVLRGQGELHLEVTLDKLRDAFGVRVRGSAPRVAYRETITQLAESEVKHVKQGGGPGQYAHVILRVAPRARGSGITFVDRSEGGVVPRAFIPAVEAGVREAAACGGVLGHPVDDVEATLVGGSFHSHDSSDLAFSIAGRKAFAEALKLGAPIVLEPVMRLEIVVPEAWLGNVLGDLAARRGRVENLGTRGERKTIAARAPLSELIGYVTRLRSNTEGRGTVSMSLAGYEPVS